MRELQAGLLWIILLSGFAWAGDRVKLKSEMDNINYSVGYQIGGDFKRQGLELNPEALVQGIRDAIENTEPLISHEQMQTTLVNLKKKLVAEQQGARRQADAAYLAENAKKEGVSVLPSGVQYRVIRKGSGKKPTPQDSVTIHYRVTRSDGVQIGSTETGNPKTYPLAKAIPGLQEVFPLMEEGAKWQIVIPPSQASGDRDPLDDLGVVIYELELVSVQQSK